MSATLSWLPGNKMRLTATVEGDNDDGTAFDGSGLTVTGTLLDRSGDTIWSGALEEVSTTDGATLYAAIADATVQVVVGRAYRLVTVATSGAETLYTNTEPVDVPTRSDGA
jgi:hypothetical protein